MNISIDVRIDLSPAFAAALRDLTQALGRRGPPPLRPYEKPDWVKAFEQQTPAEKPAPAPEESVTRADAIAAIEVPAAPPVEPEPQATEVPRWTEARNAILNSEYVTSSDRRELLAKLNALPGPRITFGQMTAIAKYRQIMARQAARAQPRAPVPQATDRTAPAVTVEEIPADDTTIRHWAGPRGLCNGGEALDIDRVNAKRVELGLSPYRRQNGLHLSAATLRAAQAADAR